ncbi:hypothetical protein, partial [Candidatus Villigracilis proximus]|uniref:hypothetical protein n=1 Tax=Candidatus Villigracilis proximus TaxID=3140683 RepID=UPI0031EF087C
MEFFQLSWRTSKRRYFQGGNRGTAWRHVACLPEIYGFHQHSCAARLLTEDDFGLVGYAVTVIAFLEGI